MTKILISLIVIPVTLAAQAAIGEKLARENDCSSCHAAERKLVGPSYSDIARRYAGQAGAAARLAARIRQGGVGNWGDVPMTSHLALTVAQAQQISSWILSVKTVPAAPAKEPAKSHAYRLKNGTTVQLDFTLYAEGKAPKITKEIFKGYALYNSYCYRCHGTDATGGELAPDLRASLNSGMKQQGFMSVAMAGRVAKGMPSWAGFLSEEDMIKVYRYVKGRSLDLIPSGRPPSEQD